MRSLGLALVALAVLIGGVALWGLKVLGASHAAAEPLPPAGASVVVATRPLAFGDQITAADLRLQPWPAGAVPSGAFRSADALVAGPPRLVLTPIAADAPVLSQQLSGPGGRATLADQIRPGMRAATLRVDDVLGVAGFVLPGDTVDILVTRAAGGDRAQLATDILLQGVRVLAVDQMADPAKNKPVIARAATVEVTPAQAEKIALAAQVGTLSLALRGSNDPLAPSEEGRRAMRLADLGGSPAAGPAPRVHAARHLAERRGAEIELVRGDAVSRVNVPIE